MSIIEKLVKIINEGDTNGAKEVMHDDFKFLMHSSGKTLSKDDVVKWVGMKDIKIDKHRILFENNEVGFMHAFTSYNDGNKEGIKNDEINKGMNVYVDKVYGKPFNKKKNSECNESTYDLIPGSKEKIEKLSRTIYQG